MDFVEARTGRQFPDYESLRSWSVGTGFEDFWTSVWEFFEVQSATGYEGVHAGASMAETRWFTGATLNYAEHMCRAAADDPDGVAVVGVSDTRPRTELTWSALVDQVARARTGLQSLGVTRGDRVAAYLPNIPEAVVGMLATASLGAIWTSCAPEFGVAAVADRFGQIEPKVLLAVDGYRYGKHRVSRLEELRELVDRLPTVEHTVMLPYLDAPEGEGELTWSDLLSEAGPLGFDQVDSDHPLYILYSSGTTGLPKAIVHSHVGILLEHLKVLGLHADLRRSDTFFWYSTTGWMMWNYLVSGLLFGSTVVLFDGDPNADGFGRVWEIAAEEHVTWFGAGASWYSACLKQGVRPRDQFDLGRIRAVGSTGSPLSADAYEWIYEAVAPAAMLSPVSGGTDICSGFVGGSPMTSIRVGEIPCRYLGVAVEAFDADGNPVVGTPGELVVTRPMPSMPLGFWGDVDGQRYRRAYFEHFPGLWRHGDWITIQDDGSCTISGRSDATLNRGGVRIGTAELYRVIEAVAGVDDSLVVHLEDPSGEGVGELVLLLVSGDPDFGSVASRVRAALRTDLSPRHVPDVVAKVGAVPTTLSGKKAEVPAKQILVGADADAVVSKASLRDPGAIEDLVALSCSTGWRERAMTERGGIIA